MTLPELESTINRAIDHLGVDKDAELARETLKGILDGIQTINALCDGMVDGGRLAVKIIERELERHGIYLYDDDGKMYFDWICEGDE